MRYGRWTLSLAASAVVLLAQPATGQSPNADVRITLEPRTGERVGGALVALVDAAERVVVEGVSAENGTRVLTAPPGTYRVRVRRIGFRPFLSEPVTVPYSGELRIAVESARVTLPAVVVTSKAACGSIDQSDRTLSLVWDEIAKALRTTQLHSRDFEGIARFFVYRSRLDANGSVLTSDTTFFRQGSRKPFGVRNPAVLAVEGYVFGDAQRGWTYFAPDETVLLSEHFAQTHCFQLVRDQKNRPAQIGIAFKPARGRRVPEIAGTLWVDRETAELREVIFHFVNSGLLGEYGARGFTRFRRVPSGAWIVDDWALRAPVLRREEGRNTRTTIEGFVEDGGGVTMRESMPASGSPPGDA